MELTKTPLRVRGINNSIYAGFGVRLGSILLDFVLLIPIALLTVYLNGLNLSFRYFTPLLSFAFSFFYSIYLVRRYGGTPGKLLLGIRIIKISGDDVTWKEAILRELVNFLLMAFSAIITIFALSKIDPIHYDTLNWMQKETYIGTLVPSLGALSLKISFSWTLSELLVLLLNNRKRALHDYIAGTVVVKSLYLTRIREEMHLTDNE